MCTNKFRDPCALVVFLGMLFTNFPVEALSLADCRNENCLRTRILDHPIKDYTVKDCKVFSGQYSDSVYEENMELLCRLFLAREKAAQRKDLACINEKAMNSDFSVLLSDIPLWLFSDELYRSLPKDKRPDSKPDVDSYNNSTAYATFSLSRTWEEKTDQGFIKYKFDVYACRSRQDRSTFYVPYFIALGKTGPVNGNRAMYHYKYLVLDYIENPPLQNELVLRQLPINEFKGRHEMYLLKDFDGDGVKDYVFVEADIPRFYKPGICLYRKDASQCKLIFAGQLSESNIVQRKSSLEIDPKKNIKVVVKDVYGEENSEEFIYALHNSKLIKSN